MLNRGVTFLNAGTGEKAGTSRSGTKRPGAEPLASTPPLK